MMSNTSCCWVLSKSRTQKWISSLLLGLFWLRLLRDHAGATLQLLPAGKGWPRGGTGQQQQGEASEQPQHDFWAATARRSLEAASALIAGSCFCPVLSMATATHHWQGYLFLSVSPSPSQPSHISSMAPQLTPAPSLCTGTMWLVLIGCWHQLQTQVDGFWWESECSPRFTGDATASVYQLQSQAVAPIPGRNLQAASTADASTHPALSDIWGRSWCKLQMRPGCTHLPGMMQQSEQPAP